MSILSRRASLSWLASSVLASGALGAQSSPPSSASVFGTVTDSLTGAAVRIVAVRDLESNASSLTDDDGHYRLELAPGTHRLEFRRIGYRPASLVVTLPAAAGGLLRNVSLAPIAKRLAPVVVSPDDDAARRIIAAAIARKGLRGQAHDYSYDASVRFVVRDLKKPADSASSILLITESRTSAYWEQPDRYQETILARRQTGNLDAQRNLVSVGEIVNFNRDRIQLGRYEIVSPLADDALEHYDYRILDTLSADGLSVIRLSLEPKPDGSPAFAGVIDIADSTFDVTGLDVAVNDAVRLGFLRNVRYRQQFKDMGQGKWMPYSIELTADLQLRIPIPGVPTRLSVQHIAALSGFRFDEGRRPAGLGEYRVIVDDNADRRENPAWASAPELPMSAAEAAAWTRIDSIAQAPPTFRRRVVGTATATAEALNNPDFFHYNRVDGVYVGAGWSWHDWPGMIPTAKLGRATGSDVWQYRIGDQVRLNEGRRVWLGATYHDETLSRPTLTSLGYNATTRALFSRIDPLDYYRERGLVATLTAKLFNLTQFNAAYTDGRQTSLADVVSGPLFGGSNRPDQAPIRPNDPIADGLLRSVSAGVSYDSRPMLHQPGGGGDTRLGAAEWTRVAIDAEGSSPHVLASDFDYRRYTLRVEHRQQSFGMGLTTFMAVGGIGTSGLPPQRYFTVDGGARVLETQASPFTTLTDSNFAGSRAAMLAVEHNFDRLLFTRSHVPLVRDIPFTLSVRAAVFWTSFGSTPLDALGSPTVIPTTVHVATSPYREAGFTVGNLTPFMSPINLALRFAWQLSNYPTGRFRIGLDLGR